MKELKRAQGDFLNGRANTTFSIITRFASTVLFPWALILFSSNTAAQSQSSYDSGRGISPVYEGWVLNGDGSHTLLFGYMNENWKQELNVPIGSENSFSPGLADRGQPTHFLPRRNRNVFGIEVVGD